ncbi:MAG TPA: hypothetical protein VG498_09425, partial [Terriglobales bacterium]|nr:hypothetical protein [Terriglobales bacterium]
MNLLLLGRGKTGSLIEDVARLRGHCVQALTSKENQHGSALTAERLRSIDAVIDFTTPDAVLENMRACIRTRKPIVVGTTGWYEHIPELEREVEDASATVLY